MAMKYLGETFDLHCGGVDLVFPHHENEIAQSEGGTGRPFVRTWVHVEHLLVEGETMSKSKGNFFTIPDLVERGHRPDAIRYLLASVHYRKQLNFTFEGLAHATAALERIHGLVRRLDEASGEGSAEAAEAACMQALAGFGKALADDLNVSEALAAVHGLVGEANALLAASRLSRAGAQRVRQTLVSMDSVFGVFLPDDLSALTAEEQALFDERQAARAARDFARADGARARLDAIGIVLEDTPKGTRWRRRA
jgi:cysteinyl-tRNA synthetase